MILYLNLLPKSEKRRLRLVKIYDIIKRESLFFLAILILLNIQVLYVRISLGRSLADIDAGLQENKQKNQSLIVEVEAFNEKVDNFQKVQADFSNKSQVILNLLKILPQGISLSSIEINQYNEMVLEGSSQTRDQLLQFKANLTNGFMQEVNFPISSLLKQEGGQFVIRGKVNSL